MFARALRTWYDEEYSQLVVTFRGGLGRCTKGAYCIGIGGWRVIACEYLER